MTNNLKYISFIEAKAIDDHLIKKSRHPYQRINRYCRHGNCKLARHPPKNTSCKCRYRKRQQRKGRAVCTQKSKSIESATLLFPLKNNQSCEFLQELQINKKISIITNSKQLIETHRIIDGLLGI